MSSPSHTRAPFMERVATAPISWGICEVPGWGQQLEPDRVLSEMGALGFTATELGAAGWLPEDPHALRGILLRHQLDLLGAFVPLVLHDPSQATNARTDAHKAAELLQAVGATYFTTAPVTSLDWDPRRPYSNDEWKHMAMMLDEIDELCSAHGLHQVLHEHFGCVVETADDVNRLLDISPVDLVLDTGHLTLGGLDPNEFALHHHDRVGLVHLKDTDLVLATQLNVDQMSLMEAVQLGLFPALGQGDLQLAAVIQTLEDAGYSGWYVVEQDCSIDGAPPAPGEGPMRDVATSVEFLRSLDLAKA